MTKRDIALERFALYVPILATIAYVVFVILTLTGCVSNDRRVTTAVGLKATKDVFIATATTAKRLCEQGVLGEEDCAEAETVYGEGRDLLITAKRLWDAMAVKNDFTARYIYDEQIKAVVDLTASIENIIRRADE